MPAPPYRTVWPSEPPPAEQPEELTDEDAAYLAHFWRSYWSATGPKPSPTPQPETSLVQT